MATDRTLIESRLSPRAGERDGARPAVAEALRVVAVDRDAVAVMVSEAVASSVAHAYPDPAKVVRARVPRRSSMQALDVVVSDGGAGREAPASGSASR